jgi:hypothetical protein
MLEVGLHLEKYTIHSLGVRYEQCVLDQRERWASEVWNDLNAYPEGKPDLNDTSILPREKSQSA